MARQPIATTSQELLEETASSAWNFLIPAIALLVDIGVVIASPSSQTVWYVIRGSGIIAYVLLAVSVIAGLLITNRTLPAGQPRVDLYEAHNFTALLILAFTSVHGAALLLDSFIGFTPAQILVPFISDYRPLAVAAGILSLYVTIIVYASFWARRHIGYRSWRIIHYASFAAFVLGALHGIFSGTDTGETWMLGIYAVSLAAVFGLTAVRVMAATEGAKKAA